MTKNITTGNYVETYRLGKKDVTGEVWYEP